MEESENSRDGDFVLIVFLFLVLLVVVGHVFLGWKYEPICPYRDRSGEWIEEC